jgi:hypothetical protein
VKIDPRSLITPLVALVILIAIASFTREALTLSGAWRRARNVARQAAVDPFAPIDHMLATVPPPRPVALRDPFNTVAPPVAANLQNRPKVHHVAAPAPPPPPVLTSIFFDADPRATVRFNGRDYSVRAGALFADFRVVSIARDQVVLDQDGKSVVLQLPRKGENP